MRKENGITLVALVITIIVMLILVGVTVTVALNGGLFQTAKKAAQDTEKARIQEEIMSVTLAATGGNPITGEDLNALKTALTNIDGVESASGDSFPLTVTTKYGTLLLDQYGGTTESDAKKIISFTYGKTYYAEEGMTWEEWCNSEYNTDGWYYEDGNVFTGGEVSGGLAILMWPIGEGPEDQKTYDGDVYLTGDPGPLVPGL